MFRIKYDVGTLVRINAEGMIFIGTISGISAFKDAKGKCKIFYIVRYMDDNMQKEIQMPERHIIPITQFKGVDNIE